MPCASVLPPPFQPARQFGRNLLHCRLEPLLPVERVAVLRHFRTWAQTIRPPDQVTDRRFDRRLGRLAAWVNLQAANAIQVQPDVVFYVNLPFYPRKSNFPVFCSGNDWTRVETCKVSALLKGFFFTGMTSKGTPYTPTYSGSLKSS